MVLFANGRGFYVRERLIECFCFHRIEYAKMSEASTLRKLNKRQRRLEWMPLFHNPPYSCILLNVDGMKVEYIHREVQYVLQYVTKDQIRALTYESIWGELVVKHTNTGVHAKKVAMKNLSIARSWRFRVNEVVKSCHIERILFWLQVYVNIVLQLLALVRSILRNSTSFICWAMPIESSGHCTPTRAL